MTLMSWYPKDFLIYLVMVGREGKDVVKEVVVEYVDLSCLLNFLRMSLLGFPRFCLTLSIIPFNLSGGIKEVV